jgi:hypothetical protein
MTCTAHSVHGGLHDSGLSAHGEPSDGYGTLYMVASMTDIGLCGLDEKCPQCPFLQKNQNLQFFTIYRFSLLYLFSK